MMELDELKTKWQNQGRQLEESQRLNRELLSAAKLNSAQSLLRRDAIWAGVEAAMWLVLVIALGSFTAGHLRTVDLRLSALAADVMSIGMLIALVQRTVRILQIDYTEAISTSQKKLEGVRVLRIQTTQWRVLCGTLLWVPSLAVVTQALFRLDIYNLVSPAWLIANAAFGLALFPLTIWVARKYGDRIGGSTFIRGLMKDLDGENLSAARKFLASLKQFGTHSSS